MQTVIDTNPGSRWIVTTKFVVEHPSTNCLGGCIQGFLNGCRPFLGTFLLLHSCCDQQAIILPHCYCFFAGLDGCFVKLTTGQQILCATARDGNNNIFPLAFGLVDKEETSSWSWFLTQLKYAIGGEQGKFGYYTIISDRQKVSVSSCCYTLSHCKYIETTIPRTTIA